MTWPRNCDPLGIGGRERSQVGPVKGGRRWLVVWNRHKTKCDPCRNIKFYHYQCFNIVLNIILVSLIPVITFDIHQEPISE